MSITADESRNSTICSERALGYQKAMEYITGHYPFIAWDVVFLANLEFDLQMGCLVRRACSLTLKPKLLHLSSYQSPRKKVEQAVMKQLLITSLQLQPRPWVSRNADCAVWNNLDPTWKGQDCKFSSLCNEIL